MREMVRYLRPYWGRLTLASLAVGVSTVCDLLLPTIMSDILDNGVYAENFTYIVTSCAVMLALALLALATVLAGYYLSAQVVEGYCADVRREVFRKVNAMSFEEYGQLGTAALVNRATHDVNTVSWVASMLSSSLVSIPVLFFGGAGLAMSKDVGLSLVLLAFVPVIFAVVVVLGRKCEPLWQKGDDGIDHQNSILRERLRGIRVIRAFNAEEREHQRIAGATREMAESLIRGNVAMGALTPLATLFLNLAIVLIAGLSGWRMERGSGLTGGDVFAIIQYVALISNGVLMGAFAVVMAPRAQVAAGRIGQVLHAEGMADPLDRQDIALTGEIRLDHVTFAYEGAQEPALQDVSLTIHAGQKAAVIGGTGSGKSTLVQLLLGFRMPVSGEVLLDGRPTTDLSRRTIRDNIGCVLQNTALYSGTIRENVALGKQGAADGEIWQALEIAQAGDYVAGLPEELAHKIRQSGKNLSGGQKQRLCIARAVLKNAPISIFDDSFSALDFLTEAKLRNALGTALEGKTQLIVTQRITSAMHCDCIFVLDGGRLVDSGTHEELLSRCQVYQEIYASQTGGKHLEKAAGNAI